MVARAIAMGLRKELGQAVIVENRPGAGGSVGMELVAMSAADGYTLLYSGTSLVLNKFLFRSLPFDVQKDFTPIGTLASAPLFLVANPESGPRSLQDLIETGKTGKQYAVATPGIGTPHHFAGVWLASSLNLNFIHIPYKGSGPAATDVVSGQVPLVISTFQSVEGFMKSGKLRPIALTSAERIASLKDVPTVNEFAKDVVVTVWHGLLAPAGLPVAIRDSLSSALAKAVSDAEVIPIINRAGFDAVYGSADAMQQRIQRELSVWQKVASDAKIVPE
ncbi:MAG: Bug family tripartite tricarboxylate transporter substrate binding protein [Dehalococcoidia bacterium]